MAYIISENCIKCKSCETECPNGAIREDGDHMRIDPNRCTECVGAFDMPQCADICPIGAPGPDPAHRETREELQKKWNKLHPKKKAA